MISALSRFGLTFVICSMLTACGGSKYVDASPGNSPHRVTLGWHKVEPIRVKVPTDDPLNGEGRAAATHQRGPVLVNLWASYCGPCTTELPLLEQVNREKDLQVIGLSRDSRSSLAKAALKKAKVTYPNWMDPAAAFAVALDGRIPLSAIPSSALLVDGKVVAVHIGDFKTAADVLHGLELTD